jgi:hypothetical protein
MENSQTLNTEIASRIASVSEAVYERVVNAIVEKEVVSRADIIAKGIGQLSDLERELARTKADSITYNDDGTVASSAWSKPKLDAKNKLVEKISKIKSALDDALSGKMDKLSAILRGKGDDQKADQE